jgi:anti-sigma B factor antagonist
MLGVAPTGECWEAYGLRITVREASATRALFVLSGELDLASAPLLSACLEHHLGARRLFLRLELGGLSFIDAAGLAAVVTAHHDVAAKHGTLTITSLAPQGARLIELVGLDEQLLIATEDGQPHLAARPA